MTQPVGRVGSEGLQNLTRGWSQVGSGGVGNSAGRIGSGRVLLWRHVFVDSNGY